MEKRTTKISRSWGTTIGYLIGGIVALAISAVLFMTIVEGPVTIGIALIPAILGLILVGLSFGGAGRGTCPICNAELSGLSKTLPSPESENSPSGRMRNSSITAMESHSFWTSTK
jgi:hypothetical protein